MFIKLFVRNSLPLLLSFSLLSVLSPGVWAGVVGTQQLLQQHSTESAGALLSALDREDVRYRLIEMGVDPEDAKKRVMALDEAEIAEVRDSLNALPAGAGVLEVAVAVLVVLVILDLVGVTDIFTFIP